MRFCRMRQPVFPHRCCSLLLYLLRMKYNSFSGTSPVFVMRLSPHFLPLQLFSQLFRIFPLSFIVILCTFRVSTGTFVSSVRYCLFFLVRYGFCFIAP